MRNIHRPAVFPPTTAHPTGKGHAYAIRLENEELLRKEKFPPHWKEDDVRGVLRAMCGWACAYCLDIIGRPGEDVEHFRPKSHYWWLAYSLGNYLSSCGRCNSSRKVSLFPVGAARAADPTSDLEAEQRLLLDPTADDVEALVRIEVSGPDRVQYRQVAGANLTPRQQVQAEETIRFFHLNDDVELARARTNAIADALRGLTSADADVRAHARRKMSRFQPFGGAVRSVVAQLNPALLASPEEELRWFFDELIMLLGLLDRAQVPDKKLRRRIGYTLASLWRDPPSLTPADIEQWLVDANRRAEVVPLYDALAAPGP